MRTNPDFHWWNLLPVVCGVLITCLGFSVIIAWHLGITSWLQLQGGWAPMQYNAALCLSAVGLALISASLAQTRAPLALGAFVVILSGVTGLQYLLGIDLGVDRLLFAPEIGTAQRFAGRMGPNTAVCLVMVGIAIALMGYRVRNRQPSSLAIILGSLTMGLAMVSLAGYTTGLEAAYGWGQFPPMPIHGALGLALAGLGVTAFHWPQADRQREFDINRVTGLLISLTTFGVVLVVLFAAVVGLIPLYDQLRQAKQNEISQRLHSQVSDIQNIWDRTSGLAEQLDIGALTGLQHLNRERISGGARFALTRAMDKVEQWSGPGHAYLGLLQPHGARVLNHDNDANDLVLTVPDTTVATGIIRGVEGHSGLTSVDTDQGRSMLVFYSPVGQTGWVVVTAVPSDELYAEADRQVLLVGVGILLVTLFGALGVARLLQPLTSGILVHSEDMKQQVRSATGELEVNVNRLERTNRDLQQFAYAVSHDLQAPLRGIDGFAGLLVKRHQDNLNEEAREYLALIRQSVAQMSEFIQGLLMLSRVDTRQQPLTVVSLDRALEQARAKVRFDLDDVGAELTVPQPLPEVVGDELQLTQLFQNLLDNAIKFRHPGRPLKIRVTARQQGDFCRCEVSDNGIGIDANQRERIFEIFQRCAPDQSTAGSGIGLSLCRKIIDRHGGEIHVEDTAGGGACFVFTLVRADTDTAERLTA